MRRMISKCSSSVMSTSPGLGELIELPFDHAQRDVAEQPDELERVLRERQRHRLDVEVVAEQDGDVVAPARVRRQPAAPHVGVVDDVVVHQRRGVDELDDRRVEHGAIAGVAAEARGHQQHGRAHALAAALLDVAAHLGDERDAGLDVADELVLDASRSSRIGSKICARSAAVSFCAVSLKGCGFERLGLTIPVFRAHCQRAKPLQPRQLAAMGRAPHEACRRAPAGPKRRAKFSASWTAMADGGCAAPRPASRRRAHVGRLVALAAVRHRREIRRVGLDSAAGRSARRARPRAARAPSETSGSRRTRGRNPSSSAAPRHRRVAGEAVEHAADRGPALLFQDRGTCRRSPRACG